MWIRSQNRRCLIQCNEFYIDEKHRKEGTAYWILGVYKECLNEEEDACLLGVYNSLSTASDILDCIQGHIIAKSPVYQMPVDEEDES